MPTDGPIWHDRGRILAPDPSIPFAARAVKDPSIVQHDGAYHLFYTAISMGEHRSLGYIRSPRLDCLAQQVPQQLRFDGVTEAAAPFIFFERGQELWYLLFQIPSPERRSYIPVYATNASLDPAGWSAPNSLLPGDADVEHRRIDFWMIADRAHVFLFYWDNVGGTWCLECPRDRFPWGFTQERRVFSLVEPTWEMHEAGCIYWVADQEMYLLLGESILAAGTAGRRTYGDERQYRFYTALTATDLRGPWYLVHTPFFARVEQVQMGEPRHWLHNISHGEVLRSNVAETPTILSRRVRFLVQSQADPFVPAESFRYGDLRWELGLIELEQLPALQACARPDLLICRR